MAATHICGMAIDDDLASIGKFNFDNAAGPYFTVEIGVSRLERSFYELKHFVSHLIELGLVHRVLVSSFISHFSTMRQIFFLLGLFLLLSACGTKGPLTLPPKQEKTISPIATQLPLADVNTAAGRH